MTDKKILVIFTGGTIGSAINGESINVESDCKFRLVADYNLFYGERNFECIQLYNILSENVGFTHWEKLVEYLLKVNTSEYSGIIITHGSDTLSYKPTKTSALIDSFFATVSFGYLRDDFDSVRAPFELIDLVHEKLLFFCELNRREL